MKFGIICALVCVMKSFRVNEFSKYLYLIDDENKKKPLSEGAFLFFYYSITRLSLLVSLVSPDDPF